MENLKVQTTSKPITPNTINLKNLKNTISNCDNDDQLELVKAFKSDVLMAELKYRLNNAETKVESIEKITRASYN